MELHQQFYLGKRSYVLLNNVKNCTEFLPIFFVMYVCSRYSTNDYCIVESNR